MATDSISTSALHPEHRRFIELKKRCDDLGYRLIVADTGEQFVLGGKHGLECVFIHQSDADCSLAEWLDRCGDKYLPWNPDADDYVDPIDRARGDAQMVGYGIRLLIEAARKLNTDGEDIGPIEAVLDAADAKLGVLIDSLDSVNWPDGGAK